MVLEAHPVRRGVVALAALCTGFAGDALAFDCSKAGSEIEKAICASPAALAANDEMESAYFALRERLSDKAASATLRDGQRAWIRYRDTRCGAGAECLESESRSRAETLGSVPRGMVPTFRYQQGGPKRYAASVAAYRFVPAADPGEAAFNAALEAILADVPFGDNEDVEPDRAYEYEIFVSIGRGGGRLISAVANTYAYSGGAHPNSWSSAINIDMLAGRTLDLVALFGADGLASLEDACARQVLLDREDIYGDADDPGSRTALEREYPGVIAEHVRDSRRWFFDQAEAIVTFDSYAIGPYAAGPFECLFEISDIAAMASDKALFD
jgi:uncharacterized protein